MAFQISERGRRMPASPIRKLMPLADEAKRLLEPGPPLELDEAVRTDGREPAASLALGEARQVQGRGGVW